MLFVQRKCWCRLRKAIDIKYEKVCFVSYTNGFMKSSLIVALHKKWSFPLMISSVNVTKFAGNCGFGHIYWKNPSWKTLFFEQCECRCRLRKASDIKYENICFVSYTNDFMKSSLTLAHCTKNEVSH